MKERPIPFSGDMVKAILDGRKTQTRRLRGLDFINENPGKWSIASVSICGGEAFVRFIDADGNLTRRFKCPYGKPGDELWVREAWYPAYKRTENSAGVVYRADYGHRVDLVKEWNPPRGWKPSIHMPRWASRIQLVVKDVRVERLQGIDRNDCVAEGVTNDGVFYLGSPHPIKETPKVFMRADQAFHDIWDSINAKKHPWSENPWVWVVEFDRTTT